MRTLCLISFFAVGCTQPELRDSTAIHQYSLVGDAGVATPDFDRPALAEQVHEVAELPCRDCIEPSRSLQLAPPVHAPVQPQHSR